MKKISFILLLTLVLTSCIYEGCNQLILPKEAMDWNEIYLVNDTFIFRKVDDEDLTNIFIREMIEDEFTPCNKFELGQNQTQKTFIRLNNLHKYKVKNSFFAIQLIGADSIHNYKINFEVSDLSFFDINYNLNLCNTRIQSKMRNDSLDVYLIEKSPNYCNYEKVSSRYPHSVDSFYWSKEFGLVKYSIDGEEFELFEIR